MTTAWAWGLNFVSGVAKSMSYRVWKRGIAPMFGAKGSVSSVHRQVRKARSARILHAFSHRRIRRTVPGPTRRQHALSCDIMLRSARPKKGGHGGQEMVPCPANFFSLFVLSEFLGTWAASLARNARCCRGMFGPSASALRWQATRVTSRCSTWRSIANCAVATLSASGFGMSSPPVASKSGPR